MKKVVFVVLIEEIENQEIYDTYIRQVVKIIQQHNGEYIARSNKILPLSGRMPERSIVIGFDSMEEARKCFFSEEYERIKHLRENSTKSRAFFIENE
ncbi:MAG: DUF1330 domain-containing protein [Desulfovibrionales bacterium]|nr:DUF1330 domain-containing protein [Desulfovibrionales bacterium]